MIASADEPQDPRVDALVRLGERQGYLTYEMLNEMLPDDVIAPDEVGVEEGFLTFTALPANFLLKVGKMRASFGKVNQMHNHVMPWTDRPLVTRDLVGGEEGISDAGLSLSRLFVNPVLFLEATAEAEAGQR